jgi:DNA-binding response OmpR family regulator
MKDEETLRVLVVDDEEALRNMVDDFLTPRGFAVATAFDGNEALSLLESASFDLLLLDERMPNRSGLDTLHTLRDRGISTPVLLMTAYVDNIAHTANVAPAAFIAKPFDPDELEERIRRLINVARA